MDWNTTSIDESLQDNNGNVTPNGDKQTTTDDYKAKHDALYGKYTAKAEKELELSKRLFKANAEEIESFNDTVKNKIVKETYWYDTFEEAKAILWEGFYKKEETNAGGDNEVINRISILEKEKKVADYKMQKLVLDNKIDLYIANTPSMSDDMKEKIKTELSWISESLDVDSRIENAAALAKFKYWSNEDITFATTTSWWTKNIKTNTWAEPVRNPELARIFGNS